MRLFLVLLFAFSFLYSKDYRGAEYRTKAAYTYGKIEIRMRSADASGMLSSLFTYHDGGGTANWNEIDIEIMGRYDDEVQFNTITPGRVDHVYRHVAPVNPHADFHEYAIEWTPYYVSWHVDGKEVYRQDGSHIQTLDKAQKIMMNVWPPEYPDWAGTLETNKLPVFAFYDWIRYYRYTPGENDNFTLLWEDNFDSFDAIRWQKATHTFDGNNCDFITQNAAFQDGYLILCLTRPNNIGYSGGMITEEDKSKPYVHGAFFFDDSIRVDFSETPQLQSAETASNYLIPGLTVVSAKRNGRSVWLKTEGRDQQVKYNLLALNVADDAGNVIELDNTVILNALPDDAAINVGSAAFNNYLEDQNWVYNSAYGNSGGNPVDEDLNIAGTTDDAVFSSELRGIGFYDIRVSNGVYDVELLFSENEHDAAGQRVFDVYAENELMIDDLDIFAEAGARTALTTMLGAVHVTDNRLTLVFEAEQGQTTLSGIVLNKVVSALPENSPGVPQGFNMQVYPNPFNPSTKLQLFLGQREQVQADVVNLHGQVVKNIYNGVLPAAQHAWTFNATNLPSGVYFFRVSAGRYSQTQKMLLLR